MQIHKKKMKDKRMYKIILEDGSDLLVSGKHRVYASKSRISKRSLGENNLTFDCNFSLLSPENIGQSLFNASAKYGESFLFSSNASANLSENSKNEIGLICDLISSKELFSCSLVSLVNEDNSSIWSSISENTNAGEMNSNFLASAFFLKTLKHSPFVTEAENITLKSTTNSIYLFLLNNSWYFFATDSFISSANFIACSSVNSDLDSIFSTSAHAFNLSSCLINSSLANSDQFTQENLFNSDFISSGIVKTADAIYINPLVLNSSNFFNSSSLLSMPLFITSFQLTSGCSFLNLLSSFGADIVKVAILLPSKTLFLQGSKKFPEFFEPQKNIFYFFDGTRNSKNFLVPPDNSVYIQKSVDVYKPFDSFSLMPVTDVYSSINNGKEVYSINENNLEHDFTSLEDERCMMLGEKINKIEEVNKK